MEQRRLTIRQEKFCRAYIELGVARWAYVAAGYKGKPGRHQSGGGQGAGVADVEASKMLRRPHIVARLAELREAMAKRNEVTEDSLIEELEEARRLALADKQAGAAVSATMGKAKVAGLLIERKEIGDAGEFARMSEAELKAYLSEHASPEPDPKPTTHGNGTVN